jgi:hypothetical protein
MPDPRAVALVLGGETRHLFYDLNALCRLKTECGINVLAPGEEDTRDPATLRALLWAGLLHEAPGLTVEDVGRLIGLGDMGPAAAAFAEAFQRAAQPLTEFAPDPSRTPEESTGTSSPASPTGS